ncbi:MAG: GvpL/GvpF family gas vesicle protein, partial [Atribacterota bacterium]
MIYVFCVTDRAPDFTSGFERGEQGIYAIEHKGLFAVVNRVSEDDFGESHVNQRLTDTDWLKSKVLEHEETVERVMLDGPLLPFKFAT